MANEFNVQPIQDFNQSTYGASSPFESMFDTFSGDYDPTKNFMSGDTVTPSAGLWDKTTDFLGSKTFGNVAAGAGMAADAYFKYQTLENERKFKDKMFDLQEGQIAKQDALRTGTQSAYAAGSGRTV